MFHFVDGPGEGRSGIALPTLFRAMLSLAVLTLLPIFSVIISLDIHIPTERPLKSDMCIFTDKMVADNCPAN